MRKSLLPTLVIVGAMVASTLTGVAIGSSGTERVGPNATYSGCLLSGKITKVLTQDRNPARCEEVVRNGRVARYVTWNATGPEGPQGKKGAPGAAGARGLRGPVGSDGADGARGPAGPTGPAGADGGSAYFGNDQSLGIRDPYLAVGCLIAIQGESPGSAGQVNTPFLGQMVFFAGGPGSILVPAGWAACDGQLLDPATKSDLFSVLGTTYGGDGRTTFALPDLRGRSLIGFGQGPGLSDFSIGSKGGNETVTLTVNNLPEHRHD